MADTIAAAASGMGRGGVVGVSMALRIIACVVALAVLWPLYEALSHPPNPKLLGFRRAGLAFELAGTAAEVKKQITTTDDGKPSALSENIRVDWLVIFVYWLLVFGLARTMRDRAPVGPSLGALAMVAITGAALFDIAENVRQLQVLRVLDHLDDATVRAVLHASRVKWALFFAALVLCTPMLFSTRGWWTGAGAAFAMAGAVGASGLAADRRHVETGFYLALAGFVLLGLASIFSAGAEARGRH